jgi:hypothetical protein
MGGVSSSELECYAAMMSAFLPDGYYFSFRTTAAREAEERDRREWIDGVKQRLGLVVIGDPCGRVLASACHEADTCVFDTACPFIANCRVVEWPAGIPDGPWEVVSGHTLELPLGWPEGCRCVISDGVRVLLGGPCPAHSAERQKP